MRVEKEFLLDELKDNINNSHSLIITKYNQLSPTVSWNFYQMLGRLKGSYEVVKKRVFFKALEKNGLSFDVKAFPGHIGVVFIQGDAVAVAKAVFDFSRENSDFIEVLSALIEGNSYSAADVQTLSKLPAQNELRAQFLGLLEAPMAQTLSVMEGLVSSVLYCFMNKSSKEN